MYFLVSVISLVIFSGCSKKEKGTKETYTGYVNMQLANSSSSSITAALSKFEVKLVSAYVTQSNTLVEQGLTKQTHTVFLNKNCNESLRLCDISGGPYTNGEIFDNVVTSYFDFTNPEAANEELNSQNRPLIIWQDTSEDGSLEPPADPNIEFTHAVMEFCKLNNEGAASVLWSAGTVVGREYLGTCGISEIELEEPMVVRDGDNILMTVSYNLDSVIKTGIAAMGDDCVGTDADRVCFTMPQFLPSAEKATD